MKAFGFFILYVSLVEFLPPYCHAKHHKPNKHHAVSHKHHNSTPKITSTGVSGSLKNVILHKTSNRQNNETLTAGKSTGQAMGRDILVHNANTGVGHVVQGSKDGHAPVIVINSDAAGGKSGSLDPFSQDCLDAHNNYRARHGVPPLIWSHELAEGAQAWADQLASTDSLQHDQVAVHNHKIGENLAYFQPAVPKCEGAMVDNCVNCREMIQRWYNEVKNYDYDKGGPMMLTSPYKHFTQLIWANTAEVGVGTAISKRYGFITVARYRPTGNEGDLQEFISNVPPEGGPLPTVSPHADSINQNQGANTKALLATDSSGAASTDSDAPLEPEAAPPTTITVKEMSSAGATSNNNASSVTSNSSSLAKSADMAAVVENDDATGNKLPQPEPVKKVAQTKGGFVHTLTANDGTKAQVYLSRNGAHAGIVFRNQISRAPMDDEKKTSGIKRKINVL